MAAGKNYGALIGAFFRLIRWPNLLLLWIGQALFYLLLLRPLGEENWSIYLLYALATVSLAAAGYLINDYYDLEIDRLNEREGPLGQEISIFWGFVHYAWLQLLPLSLAAIYSPSFLLPILLGISFLLWAYSAHLKAWPLLGNLLVAALVLASLGLYYIEALPYLRENRWAKTFFEAYLVFAFGSNLVREIAKDREDLAGDQAKGTFTLAYYLPSWALKSLLFFLLLGSLGTGVSLVWPYFRLFSGYFWGHFLLLAALLLLLIFVLIRAKTKKDWRQLSLLLKIYMALGLAALAWLP